ncbi:hypothetical protein ACFV4Q_12630 [Streptomyces nojiriensis]|uniref:hypothetical protein n=1 Tax=Streptomyces nojiriensis TaxID=66374 RepID=UPI00364B056F
MNAQAQVYDREFRVRGLREQGWGRGLAAAAALIWLWVAYLLVFPFSIDRGENTEPIECDSRAFHQDTDFKVTYQRDEGERCDAERDLGPMLAALLLSLPLATVGAGLYASGTSAVRTAAYAAEITRLDTAREG